MNDKLQKLYNLYLEKGIITDATSFETFSQANPNQVDALYNLGKKNGLFVTTELASFQDAWATPTVFDEEVKDEPVKKKEDTESVSEDGLLESQISDEQAELMRNFSGSGFEFLSTEEIKEQFQTTSEPSSLDVAQDPERYKVVTGADGFDDVVDIEAEDPELRKQNIERYEISQMPDNERYAYVNNQRVDLYHPDINKRQQIRRDYIQYLNEGVPTMKQLMVRGMGASQAAEEISKSQKFRNELAQKFRQENEEADGITKEPTFRY